MVSLLEQNICKLNFRGPQVFFLQVFISLICLVVVSKLELSFCQCALLILALTERSEL